MKKIICLILALACVFSVASCGKKEQPIDKFIKVVNESAPTKIKTLTTVTYGSDILEGTFTTTVDGENSTTEYEYQRLAIPGVDAGNDAILTENGTVYYKDGKYSEDGTTWGTSAPHPGALQIDLNLAKNKLGKYTLDADKLTTTLSADEALAVLGVKLDNISADGVNLTVESNGTYLTRIIITYSVTEGEGENIKTAATVSIKTSYTYTPLQTEGANTEGENAGAEGSQQ